MSLQKLPELSSGDFRKNLIDAGQTALICFVSDWSAPCREMEGVFLQAADCFYGTVPFYRIDPDNEPLVAAECAVSSIPTLVLFSRGEEIDRMVGVRKCEDIEKMILKNL